jgi:ATP-dependent helicase/nuclease subunit B
VKSRWLWRLETLAKGAAVDLPERTDVVAWARAMDAPIQPAPAELKPVTESPKPRPPVSARPRQLPVTGVEAWVRDPYSIYARRVLNLKVMDRPDEPLDARARGSAIHKAFERFAQEHPEISAESVEVFENLLVEQLEANGVGDAYLARERPLARNLAAWVVELEKRRRTGAELVIETEAAVELKGPAGPFTLTAKPDRLEVRQGTADILDFKTGAPPSAKEVAAGFAPQLTLTAALVLKGAFAKYGAKEPGDLVYVRVTGRREPGEEKVISKFGESRMLAEAALEKLEKRIAWFDDERTPYKSWSAPKYMRRWGGDYNHLARVWEWAVLGAAGEEGSE